MDEEVIGESQKTPSADPTRDNLPESLIFFKRICAGKCSESELISLDTSSD
jgi:hypothetical protein